MAFSFQGIGTTFYGERDFHPDGTYITTEWVVFLAVPIIPLRSLRVRYDGPGDPPKFGFGSSASYSVYEKGFPNWKQVIYVYLFVGFYMFWCSSLFSHGDIIEHLVLKFFSRPTSEYVFAGIFLFSMVVPAVVPFILRLYARSKARA
jgi:hypothetical protein